MFLFRRRLDPGTLSCRNLQPCRVTYSGTLKNPMPPFPNETERLVREVATEGGVLSLCTAVVIWPWTLASLLCQDGARRAFNNQADIACTKRESP